MLPSPAGGQGERFLLPMNMSLRWAQTRYKEAVEKVQEILDGMEE